MRLLIIASFAMLTPFFSTAQFSKGDKTIGGFFSISAERTPPSSITGIETSSKGFSLYPHIGFFLNERVSIEVGPGFTAYTQRVSYPNSPENFYRSNWFGVSLRARKYAGIAEGFLFSIVASASYGNGYSQASMSAEKSRNNSASVSVAPAFHFFPTKNWCIEGGVGSLSFSRSYQKATDTASKHFYLGLGTVSFGLAYYIRQ